MKKRLLTAVLAASLLVGCGGGGGGDSTPPPVVNPSVLYGTYALSGFDVKYSNGVFVDETNPVVKSYGGTMRIRPDGYVYQSVTLNGSTEVVSGYVNIVWDTASSGRFLGANNVLLATFTMSGNDLTTYSGVTPLSGTNLTYEEWDYWHKTSNSYAPEVESLTPEVEQHGGYKWLGELLN